jgi:hypothetical protein
MFGVGAVLAELDVEDDAQPAAAIAVQRRGRNLMLSGRRETEDGRRKTGDGRRETGDAASG